MLLAQGGFAAFLEANANQRAELLEELTGTENRISFARQAYNDSVMSYNTATEVFPQNIIAGMFRFVPATLLESTESPDERKPPKVSFSK